MRTTCQRFLKLSLFLPVLVTAGCFKLNLWGPKEETPKKAAQTSSNTLKKIAAPISTLPVPTSDKGLAAAMRLFEQADAVHREVWRVLTEQSLPVTKTPFGKVYRALLSSQNKPLSNKSFFLCDRYAVQRNILKADSYPQKFQIFESCQKQGPARKPFANFEARSSTHLKVQFYPSALEDIFGLGPAILNKTVECELKGTETGALLSMLCRDWAQNKDKEQMISLDSYVFQSEGANLIVLKGKIHEDLREVRSLDAKIPAQGDIQITETELHAPEPETTPVDLKPIPKPTPVKMRDGIPEGLTPQQAEELREVNRQAEEERKATGGRHAITPLPGSEGHVPPQRFKETPEGPVPVDEAGDPLPQDPETGEYYQPEGSAVTEPDDDLNMYPPEGAPGGQNLPSPDLPTQMRGGSPGSGTGSNSVEAPLPPPRSQPRGGNSNGR